MSISVEAQNLTVRFGDFTAVDKVSFKVSSGEIFGFLGANGAGKTTTIRVLCGLLEPTSGTVRVAGRGFEGGADQIKALVGYMSQKFTLYRDLTVGENLNFAGNLRKMSGKKLESRINDCLSFVGYTKTLDTLVEDLPGGIKQQVSLASAILHDPEIVFLDEPTAGVTPVARAMFWKLIKRLAGRGKTVFVTTHYLDEAEQCGRVALMSTGKIIALDEVNVLKTNAFPNGLYEITPKSEPRSEKDNEWKRVLDKEKLVSGSLRPHGLRFHAAVEDENRWKQFVGKFEGVIDVKKIRPSLEDVFIELLGDSA